MIVGGYYAKFAQNSVTQQHLLGTGARLLAEASPYCTICGIGYRADHENDRCPPAWRGLNLLRCRLCASLTADVSHRHRANTVLRPRGVDTTSSK